MAFASWLKATMQRRIFFWFAAAIVTSMAAATVVGGIVGPESSWRRQRQGMERFVATRYDEVWDRPEARQQLGSSIQRDAGFNVAVFDAEKRLLSRHGDKCKWHSKIPVRRGSRLLGHIEVCPDHHKRKGGGLAFLLALGTGVGTLWGLAWFLARRVTRPLAELERVARDIGRGNLDSRVQLAQKEPGEVGRLAASIDDMASRIAKQIDDQKELLAVVSHEIRTPLARLRVIAELVRSELPDTKVVEQLEEEVLEIDRLVGELLASSRLEFAQIDKRELVPKEIAERALERAGADVGRAKLQVDPELRFQADPTLLARALANLLGNAQKHAHGIEALEISQREQTLQFTVVDTGPGFAPEDLERAFEPFYGRRQGASRARETSLGLGLALVRRIAIAHGGTAWAENRHSASGARVTFSVELS